MKNSITIILVSIIAQCTWSQRENLGPLANSKYEEISPYLAPDGSKIFYIREDHPDNTRFGETQDVWFVRLENDSVVTESKHLGFPFNTIAKNSIVHQSPDGQVRYIKGVMDRFGNRKKSGYSQCILEKDGWGDPIELKIKGYEEMNQGNYVTNCLAPSGNVMIMSFSEEKDDDYSSLYVSFLEKGRKWSRPVRLPAPVDTHGEFGAFIASDNKTMYFSSYREGGFGSSDIYVTKRLDDTWMNWSEPKNLGDKVNTSQWDAYYRVSPSGRYAFMVGNNGENQTDLYRIPLFEVEKENKPDPVIIVEGIVKDEETGELLRAELEYINLANNYIEGQALSNPTSGEYKVILPYGKNFSINAKLEGYYAQKVNLDLTEVGEFAVVKRDILLKKIKKETVIRLNNIFFETAKWDLLPASTSELDGLVEILTDNPKIAIEIRGHTDNVGSSSSNQTLSENRAKAVVEYLVSKGIEQSRLTFVGFGQEQPTTTNDTPEGRAYNRRVEFRITKT
jgi:outer membrane protein OmpA-like peptidoglycan-associated protein